ncbi:class I SAM-dependent methyltransferase [Candidatus Parcubacteria bacterium]|nr:MAG: class I SAM-dependent methyltransferase [Candidatus Parcubacteria bacterium]
MGKGLERQRGPESKKEEYIIVEIGSGASPYIDSPELSKEYIDKLKEDESIYFIATDDSGGSLGTGRNWFRLNDEMRERELEKTGRVHFVLASGHQLPFRDNSVAEVIFRNVLGDPEARKPLEMMREAERVLKVGGVLKVIEMYTPHIARQNMDFLSRARSLERLPDAEKTGFVDETAIDEAMTRERAAAFVARFRKKELAS